MNDRVYGEFKQITGSWGSVWVGVTDEDTEGVFQYASSGVPVSNHMTPPWGSSELDGGRSENCVMVHTKPTFSLGFKKWMTYQCATSKYYMSVCEPK